MNNLLPSEWAAALEETASRVRAMWPEIAVTVESDIAIVFRSHYVHSGMMLDARPSAGHSYLAAVPLPGGGSGLPNNMTDARAYHMAVGRMLDALTLAASAMSGLRLYLDAAPCEFCGERGEQHGKPCQRCDGTGSRRETPL